jgi:endonuclease YncB( thermonuclease family)
MRAFGLAVTVLALSWAADSSPVMAQASSMGPTAQPATKSNKKDLGEAFTKWMSSGDEKKESVATSTPNTPTQSGGFGAGVSNFFSSLVPSGKNEPAAGTGPVRMTIEGTARADDANVLEVRKADGSITKVRQWGLEAPETSQWPWGPRARGELDRVLATSGGKVKCTSDGSTTRNGNVVARCFAGDTDISATLIEGGYGVEWREVSGGAYTRAEAGAKSQKRGVWSGQ